MCSSLITSRTKIGGHIQIFTTTRRFSICLSYYSATKNGRARLRGGASGEIKTESRPRAEASACPPSWECLLPLIQALWLSSRSPWGKTETDYNIRTIAGVYSCRVVVSRLTRLPTMGNMTQRCIFPGPTLLPY